MSQTSVVKGLAEWLLRPRVSRPPRAGERNGIARLSMLADGQAAAPVTEHPEWAIAANVPVAQHPCFQGNGIVGLVTARRHPTGWFVSAQLCQGTPPDDLLDFRHFVTVRVYLLLRYGPQVGVWERDLSSDGEQCQARWRAEMPPLQLHIPDTLLRGYS